MNNYSKFFFLFCLFPFFAQGQTNGQSGKLYQKPSSQSWSRPKAPTSSYITYYICLDNELQFIFSDKSNGNGYYISNVFNTEEPYQLDFNSKQASSYYFDYNVNYFTIQE